MPVIETNTDFQVALTATQIDKLTASIVGGAPVRKATKDKSIAAFTKALIERNLGNEDDAAYVLSAVGFEVAEGNLSAVISEAPDAPKVVDATSEAAAETSKKGRRNALAGRKITLNGHSPINPHREATKSFNAFEVLRNNPGATFEQLVELGAWDRSIKHYVATGVARAS